ncbi:U-box domain-containing protein 19 [Dichanthelium oligosanthes]|uniref:RING-type E3 ubiquitin transferase n=1 Tax=Dichanthelium oligosanthes TaxID=888268 RepID=A0A1E5VL79_9POAL|nr:U-box domain-containing protein 19 [Dichanthelium oligosanthes]
MPPPPPQKDRGQQPRRRRMLALPAVCPCEGIAPAPLLASLLSLAADVAGPHAAAPDVDALPALRGAARKAVRIAGLLLAFLDAVHGAASDDDAPLPDEAVLGLSELHVALQKLRVLLADCARKGARLWVLMNAELAASELRVVMGSVATAMDALPLDVVGSSADAEELAGMVSTQAWRAAERLRLDPEDDRAARGVRSVLQLFASGVTPDAEDARFVLARVGAATWSACTEESAFLEAELLERLETGGEDDNDLVLISGLMAFLVYCRVVLFDRIDDSDKGEAAMPVARPAARSATWVDPEALQCPITLELMTDPVTVATGQTYDRASIKKWIKSGCRTCPVTGERLRSAELVPNVAARGIIEQLLLSRGVSLQEPSSKHRCAVDKTASAFGAAAAGGVRLAVAFLIARMSRGTPEEQKKATYEARKLSKRNVFYRACLVEADAVPWLLHHLSSPDASVQDNAVAGLLNLSKHPAGRLALVEAGGLGLTVDAVNVAARVEARQNAAAVLFYLSSSPEYCEEISRIPEAIPTLVHLARDGAYRGRKNALVSLYGLLQCADAHGRAVSAGAVAALAGLLLGGSATGGDDDLALDAVALLARLAEQPAGARAVAASSELVTRLVDFLGESASRSAKEHCASLLASLGRHGGDRVLALLGKLPGLMPALYALIADGTPQAGKKARWLVNEIHRHYEQRQSAAAAAPPALATGDRVIRV